MKCPPFLCLAALGMLAPRGNAGTLVPSDENSRGFGNQVSHSGDSATAFWGGRIYLFRNVNFGGGEATEDAKLVVSDPLFSWSIAGASLQQSGNRALFSSLSQTVGSNYGQGTAFFYRDLDTATGTVTENARLVASDGAANDSLGYSASLSGSTALLGASRHGFGTSYDYGAAYLYRNLDTAAGTVTEHAKLVASDRGTADNFGQAVSLQGGTALVGASGDMIGAKVNQGSAYLFRNLETAVGTVTQTAKLVASDGAASDFLGRAVSLSGNSGLVGSHADDVGTQANQGSAYLFRGLNSASGTISESAKFIASDGLAHDLFGSAVALSGNHALIGASEHDIGTQQNQGAVFLYQDLDVVGGTVKESVKITGSGGAAADHFGASISLEGDRFVINAIYADTAFFNGGKAYTGRVSSFTELDEGNAKREIDGFSFESRTNWIVGKSTDGNEVTLSQGDLAQVSGSGKAVYVGQGAGSDGNTLVIGGGLVANEVYVGSLAGNLGNTLRLENAATFQALAVRLAPENFFMVPGDKTAVNDLLSFLGTTDLQVWTTGSWETVDASNHETWIRSTYSSGTGFTTLVAVPEPGIWGLAALGAGGWLLRRKRHR